MSHIVLKDIGKAYRKDQFVVRHLNLEVKDDEFLVLVGPSGCGKTTLLRMIAGLEEITEGELYIDDVKQNDKDPSVRRLSFVFQDYALLPSFTVFENIKFGLIDTKLTKLEKHKLVEDIAVKMSLYDKLGSYPHQLSGGQRQRVALARALVDEKKLIIFDEPLSNLDAVLRASMRTEINILKQNFSITGIYVTHDQIEAMSMADRIAVIIDGTIQQVGTPAEMYHQPKKLSVARFIGSPEINVIPIRFNGMDVMSNKQKIILSKEHDKCLNAHRDEPLYLAIRPQNIRISNSYSPCSIPGQISVVENLGPELLVHIEALGMPIRVVTKVQVFTQKDIYIDISNESLLFDKKGFRIG